MEERMARTSKMTVQAARVVLGIACTVASTAPAGAQSLRGSTSALDRQNRVAVQHDYTFLDTSSQVIRFVDAGYLVRIGGNADYRLKGVAFPYGRPEVKLFVTRLGRQYRSACGEQLVVTSLTRPRSRQPRNASPRSVHPTGMAVDFRRSNDSTCRAWLESVLKSLEGKGVLEAVRERRPPHYHVAVFPSQYAAYVETLASGAGPVEYFVRNGDSLWGIARQHGTSVDWLRSANNLRGSRIYPGQLLTLPVDR